MPYTIQQKINIGKVSQYLCGNAVRKGGLNGGGIDITLERKIYMVRKSIEYIYGLDNTDDTLEGTSNYLYALCAPYNLQAAIIAQAGGGVSISNKPRRNTRPNRVFRSRHRNIFSKW